ncbi:MAG: hypothetical protein ABI822_06190 [Bryobacteraceae bacterium]
MTARRVSITLASFVALLSTTQITTAKPNDSTAVRRAEKALTKIDQRAGVVAGEADELSHLGLNTQYSPDLHRIKLEVVRGEVNHMVREVNRLEAERESLAPWERQALDKTLPALNEAATEARKAIEYFDANRNLLWTGEYREDTNGIRKASEEIARSLRVYLQFEKVSGEEQRLRQRLNETSDECANKGLV